MGGLKWQWDMPLAFSKLLRSRSELSDLSLLRDDEKPRKKGMQHRCSTFIEYERRYGLAADSTNQGVGGII